MIFLNILRGRIDKEIDGIYKIKSKKLQESKDGKKFLLLTLEDRTGSVRAIDWYNAESNDEKLQVGHVVNVRGRVVYFEERVQINVLNEQDAVRRLSENEYDIERFVKSVENVDEMYKSLLRLIDTIRDEDYKTILQRFFVEDKNFVEMFKSAPAGMRIHHAYKGGLLEHSLNVAKLVDSICKIYGQLDRDLLVTGALLHDIGKVKEYMVNYNGIEVTTEELMGHIVIGVEMLSQKAKGIPYEKLLKLKHLIASHHGEFEWGSPVLPKTPEALVLHFVENMDSKVNRVMQIIDKEDREKSWSEYDSNLSRRFFLK
uniref:DNA topoisomerase I (topA) n=1 Tax=Fervidobacterium islandicum TaxID=2423 RepID=O34203_FERIS|nr:orf; similar to the Staphylococcus aureus CBF1 factor encoded by the sequence presented in GenBank Accession Number U21636 [Fervidobacterium islandicum]